MNKEHFTFNEVSTHIRYDCKTGILFWKVPTSKKVKAGDRAGSLNNQGYWRLSFRGRILSGHRVAWLLNFGQWPTMQIDHINRDRADNRIENLRDVSGSENIRNSDRSGRLGERRRNAKGFTWNARCKKWQVQVHNPKSGKPVYLGLFPCMGDARSAYLSARAGFDL